MSRLFASGGQSIGALASVLPMSIQGLFPLGLTGLISMVSKGLSRVFSSTTIQKHQFFGAQPSNASDQVTNFIMNEVQQWPHTHGIHGSYHVSHHDEAAILVEE